MCKECTRREFIEASVASSVLLGGANWAHTWAADAPPHRFPKKFRICVLFTGSPGPEDRGWNTDPKQMAAMKKRLEKAEKDLGNVELVFGQAGNAQQTAAVLKKAGKGVPVLAVNLNCFALIRTVQPVLDGNHPMIVFSLPASGHDWMYPHRWERRGNPVSLIPTRDYDELERALRLLRVVPMMQNTRILLFPPARGTVPARSPEEIKKRLGADVVGINENDFTAMINGVEKEAVQAEADRWVQNAKKIYEPDKDDIEKASRVSIALQRLVEREHAQGLAIGTCMGWLSKGFPCLGFARLRDNGIPAACEGDMDSLLTMLMFQYAFDRAGFQGNATFDTSRNALWTAHCTSALKMEGPDGEESPYLLRGHSEIRGDGCVPEVQYRLGQVITRTKFINLDTIIASTGKIIEVPEKSVRGCRTQIVTEVKDAAGMASKWSSMIDIDDAMTLLHRVVFYGDHMDSIRHLARLMKFNVIDEG